MADDQLFHCSRDHCFGSSGLSPRAETAKAKSTSLSMATVIMVSGGSGWGRRGLAGSYVTSRLNNCGLGGLWEASSAVQLLLLLPIARHRKNEHVTLGRDRIS